MHLCIYVSMYLYIFIFMYLSICLSFYLRETAETREVGEYVLDGQMLNGIPDCQVKVLCQIFGRLIGQLDALPKAELLT